MPTVDDVATAALAAVDAGDDLPLAATWVSQRYAELVAQAQFRHLREVGLLLVPAALVSGAVSVARGSQDVTGSGVSWDSTLQGRFFQASSLWYEIADASSSTLRLAQPFVEDNVTAAGYRIVCRYPTFDPQVRFLGVIASMRTRLPMENLPFESLQLLAPERSYSSAGANWYAELGEQADGSRKVEFYPYSETTEGYPYTFIRKPSELLLGSSLPGFLDLTVLKEGVLVDCLRFKMAQAKDAAMAQFWSNEVVRQERRWGQKIMEAARQDRGVDDLTLLFGEHRNFRSGVGDIRTAYDEWVARGGSLT